MIVGCECGNARVSRIWDASLGTYYYFYECRKCGYYWEGPIYTGYFKGRVLTRKTRKNINGRLKL